MSKLDVFPQCRMRNFAGLIARELGVEVRLRGSEICVTYGPPPVIFLPNLEMAREEDVLPIYGFCLHEAGHLCYTDFKVGAKSPDYLVKFIHNAIEDEYMERMLERDFPGAREMLIRSYLDGIKAVFGEKEIIDPISFLCPEKRDEVIQCMKSNGLDTSDESLISEVAKRLEIVRAAKLWILEKRRYPLPLYDWPTHPWREVFHQETNPPAKKSQQAYDQSVRIIERLGIKPCLPSDKRPVAEAGAKIDEAKKCRQEAREAKRTLAEARREKNAEARRECERTAEHYRLLEARDATREAAEELEESIRQHEKISERLKIAEERESASRKRLDEKSKRLEELTQALENADPVSKAEMERKIERLKEIIERGEAGHSRRQAKTEELRKEKKEASTAVDEAESAHEAAKNAEAEAFREYAKRAAEIRSEVAEKYRERIDKAFADAKSKLEAAKAATDAANKILAEIKKRDAEIEEHVAPSAADKVVAKAFKRFKAEDIEQELKSLGLRKAKPEEKGEVSAVFSAPARKYCPFDRSLDRVDSISETPDGCAKYELARAEYAKIIQETTERLKRLYSPAKNKLKVNVEQGRLDPRKAYKIGLGMRGVAVDLSRVWRTIDAAKDPKVAVSLLIDCSGSMSSVGSCGESSIVLARKAAAALSEVLRSLCIPHEIVGHSTCTEKADEMSASGEFSPADAANFSRITPFRGYVFKAFNEKKAPASVFGEVPLQDNLDGEAILWAVQRLAARAERTKICISISDGMPAASYSNLDELERHLFLVCKQIEAREQEGLFLFGLGIGEERVRKFYKNADVINSVADLPKTVLGIVEHVLAKLVGTLG